MLAMAAPPSIMGPPATSLSPASRLLRPNQLLHRRIRQKRRATLASACVITMDLADRETGPGRNTLLGVHLIMSMSEISVNRALDILDPVE